MLADIMSPELINTLGDAGVGVLILLMAGLMFAYLRFAGMQHKAESDAWLKSHEATQTLLKSSVEQLARSNDILDELKKQRDRDIRSNALQLSKFLRFNGIRFDDIESLLILSLGEAHSATVSAYREKRAKEVTKLLEELSSPE